MFLSLTVELYRDLQQVKEKIEQEHQRLSQLQALLRADGNKVKIDTVLVRGTKRIIAFTKVY